MRMGQKVHPIGFRVGIIKNWSSRWFNLKDYKQHTKEDYRIRTFVVDKLGRPAAIDRVEIERSYNLVNVIIHTARPGLIIGRGGAGIEELKRTIDKHVFKGKKGKELRIEVQEIRSPSTHARLVAMGVAEQLERRLPFRAVIKKTLEKIMADKEVKGAKILVKGRLGGHEMARTEWVADGQMPLQTLRADIDYAHEDSRTTWGLIGVKVWIYKGEVFE